MIDMVETLKNYRKKLKLAWVTLPEISISPKNIKGVMINDIVPENDDDDFYAGVNGAYFKSINTIFKKVNYDFGSMEELLDQGIYITSAVKNKTSGKPVNDDIIAAHAELLEKELSLFPNLQVVILNGDIAIQAFNHITKQNTGEALIEAGDERIIKDSTFTYGGLTVIPSYHLMDRHKEDMNDQNKQIAKDINTMFKLIK